MGGAVGDAHCDACDVHADDNSLVPACVGELVVDAASISRQGMLELAFRRRSSKLMLARGVGASIPVGVTSLSLAKLLAEMLSDVALSKG